MEKQKRLWLGKDSVQWLGGARGGLLMSPPTYDSKCLTRTPGQGDCDPILPVEPIENIRRPKRPTPRP